MRITQKYRDAIVDVEFAHLTRLFLREQQSSVVGADQAIGVVGALPGTRPHRAGRHDTRDAADGYLAHALWRDAAL
jgi:hypothetical protein